MKLSLFKQTDEEEQDTVSVVTEDALHEVQQALKQMNELIKKQHKGHRNEIRALEMKTNQQEQDIAKLRRLVTGKVSRNRRGYPFFLNADGGGKGNTDDSGEHMLEEDVFSLMMLNKYRGVYPILLQRVVLYCFQALCLGIGIFAIIFAKAFSTDPIIMIFGIASIILSRKIAILCKRILLKSSPWALGMTTFAVFQMGLGIAIIYDQWINTRDKCLENGGGDSCRIPFGIPYRVGTGVTFARYVIVLLVLATQTDILVSIQTVLLLRNTKCVPWDKVIGEEGNRSWGLWICRILLPNILRFIQAVVILFASFIVIVQTETIIDLLKDSTALLFVSQSDYVMFYIADMGYLGDHLAQKTAEVKATRWTVAREENKPNDEAVTSGCLSRLHQWMSYFFNIRVFILCFLCSLMIVGLSYIVAGQFFNGKWMKIHYPFCNAEDPLKIGDGYCNLPYNTALCGLDGGDCVHKPVNGYPNCDLLPQNHKKIGNGYCNDDPPYNTEECGFDGGDCVLKPVNGYPKCNLLPQDHEKIGNGYCNDLPPYNSEQCGFDGGNCVPKPVNGYDACMVHKPGWIGNLRCDDFLPYNSEQCGFDGGDCIPKPVDGYDGCMVVDPGWIGNGYCYDFPPYNTELCGFDGGDCVFPNPLMDTLDAWFIGQDRLAVDNVMTPLRTTQSNAGLMEGTVFPNPSMDTMDAWFIVHGRLAMDFVTTSLHTTLKHVAGTVVTAFLLPLEPHLHYNDDYW